MPIGNLAVTARVVGDIRENELLRAIDTIRQVHPLVGARVVFDDHHDAWFSTDNVPGTMLRTVPRISEQQWFEEICREQLLPFEPEIGPLIRFVLVYSPKISELIAFAQHTICDGTSLAILIRDILDYYADPAKEAPVLHPPVNIDYLPKEKLSISKFVKNAFINHYNNQWRKRPYYFSQEDFNEVHSAYWERSRYNAVFLQLEPKETSDLTTRCREKGITIGSAMTASFLAARQDVIGAFPRNKRLIWVPYDLRRHVQDKTGDVFCAFLGLTTFSFSYDRGKTFWENSQKIHGMIMKGVDRLDLSGSELYLLDPTLIDACCNFAYYAELIPEAFDRTKNLSSFVHDTKNVAFIVFQKARLVVPGMMTSNLGRLDFPETYGDLRLERMFFTPPANRDAPLILGGVGVSGRLTFSLNYVVDSKEDFQSFTEDMIKIRNRALELLGFPEKVNDRAM
jgi:NRPS condensation-like uncharacterized protein